jgi:hypothetical protein
MKAVRSEVVAEKSAESVLLTSCAGVRNSSVAWPKASLARTAAKESDDNSCSSFAITQSPHPQLPLDTSHFCSKLNRQTPEFKITVSPRKQRTAHRSNRQKIQICKPQNFEPTRFFSFRASVAATFRRAGRPSSANFPPQQNYESTAGIGGSE